MDPERSIANVAASSYFLLTKAVCPVTTIEFLA